MSKIWLWKKGCPKENFPFSFSFSSVLDLGRDVLRGKKNSKNFGNRVNKWLFSKILSKWTLFYSKQKIFKFSSISMTLSVSKCQKSFEKSKYLICLCTYIHKYWLFHYKTRQIENSWNHNFFCIFLTKKPTTYFFVAKVLRIIFYSKNTPPKV